MIRKRAADVLSYLSPELKADREVVLEEVKQNGESIEFASAEFRADREIISEVVRQDALGILSERPLRESDDH